MNKTFPGLIYIQYYQNHFEYFCYTATLPILTSTILKKCVWITLRHFTQSYKTTHTFYCLYITNIEQVFIFYPEVKLYTKLRAYHSKWETMYLSFTGRHYVNYIKNGQNSYCQNNSVTIRWTASSDSLKSATVRQNSYVICIIKGVNNLKYFKPVRFYQFR